MNRIVFPIGPESQGQVLADLQVALRFLIDDNFFGFNQDEHEVFTRNLNAESAAKKYGPTTKQLVSLFQDASVLEATGIVDEKTAIALNKKLEARGAFDQHALDGQQAQRVVAGQVSRDTGEPVPGIPVHAFHVGEGSALRLGADTSDTEGRYTIRYEPLPGGKTVHLRVAATGDDGRTLQSSETLVNASAVEIVDLTLPIRPTAAGGRLTGRVLLDDDRPAENITLRLYRRDFGGRNTLVAETTTVAGGGYALAFNADSANANLHIVAVRPTGEELPLAAQLNYLDGADNVTRNLVAPPDLVAAPEPEFRRLAADLRPHVGEVAALAAARETAERQDITVLNRATGWDGRLLALAAQAARLNADDQTPTSPEAYYGLLRAGLPSDKVLLAQVSPDAVASALATVRDAGIIGLKDPEIDAFKDEFRRFSTAVRLSLPVPGGNTSYGAMLAATNLSQQARDRFADVYFNHRGNDAELWAKAREQGLSEKDVGQLKLQGKLAFLAGGSREMTAWLMQKPAGPAGSVAPLSDPVQLADLGLHTAERWEAELDAAAAAAEQSVDAIIPSAYAGAPEQRRKRYAENMARRVRTSYPMEVLAHHIGTDTADALDLGQAQTPTARLLRNAASQGFRMGQTPVESFLNAHPGTAHGLTPDEFAAARAAIRDLQRTYQISTSDDVMIKMRQEGLKTAHDVTSMNKDDFLAYHGRLFPTRKEAELVYRKAEQVSSMIYSVFTMANRIGSEVAVYAASAPAGVRQSVKNELMKHYPTLETLFGSMGFCECEHCRSVLSPAAYLVDLLQYVEGEDAARATFEKKWAEQHDGQTYTSQFARPYDALIERRPDLIHIPLTCENTHTAMPYIDIVNEILEYYVAHGALAPDAARDTGGATTAELLAEPQNVIAQAYQVVREARYPLTLPFDLWLETVRQFADHFETPLADVLEAFRPSEELFDPAQPFDRAAIFAESLGLSPEEFALFTDPNPLAGGKWYELYGFVTSGPAIADPTNDDPAATLTLPNHDVAFAVGNPVTYRSAGGVHGEMLTIAAIGAADSGGAGRTLITLDGLWTAPPAPGNELIIAAPSLLRSAMKLAGHLGVTYKELVEIIKTGFVNPELVQLALFYKLGVSVGDVFFYESHRAFHEQNKDLLGVERTDLSPADQARYDALTAKDPATGRTGWEDLDRVQAMLDKLTAASTEFAPFDAAKWADDALATNEFNDVLVLADPDAGCNFDATTLQYADGRAADDIVFLRLNLFVRLWRKLGWTIEETDRALTTFTPRDAPFDADHLGMQPLRAALIYLAHLKTLLAKLPVGNDARLQLLTLWSDLTTTGAKPLYAQLFLTRSVLKSDPVFDDPLGDYLTKFAVNQMDVEPGDALDPNAFVEHTNISVSYDPQFRIQRLVYKGLLTDDEKAQIQALAPDSPLLTSLLDKVQATSRISSHVLALQGALGLTADEIGSILADAGLDLDTAKLTLPNVSLLYRHRLLAKGLKISVREMIALKALSGLDPFKALHPERLETLDQDYPFAQTLEFIKVAEEVKDSGLKIEDLEYLLRHHFDPTGKYRPDSARTLSLLKTLADGIRAIRAEHAVPGDPAALSDEVLQQKLGLALPADVAGRLLAMLNGTAEFTAVVTDVSEADALRPAVFVTAPAIVAVSPHNAARQEQKLTCRGVLFPAQQTALEDQFKNHLSIAQQETFTKLLIGVQKEARAFFDKHLQKQEEDGTPAYGFLDAADYDLLFDPDLSLDPPVPPEEIEEERARRRRAPLAAAFLPFLQARLIRQFVLQTLTAHTGADPALMESLLTDARLLGMPPDEDKRRPLLDALTATAEHGLTVTFFSSSDGTGERLQPLETRVMADTGPLPTGANSARLEGHLEVPESGAYRFFVRLDKENAAATLRFAHLPRPTLTGAADDDGAEVGHGPDEFTELKPGILYRFTLDLHNLNAGGARLLVQGETLPKDGLEQLPVCPSALLDGAERALTLLNKTLQLLQALGLSEREARYLLTHAADFGDVDLSQLPTEETGDTPAGTQALFGHFLHLAAYTRLKRDLAPGTNDLIGVFEAQEAGGAAAVYPVVARLARRDEATVKATAEALSPTPAFASEEPLLRLWEALQIVERCGVPVASLLSWTGIVHPATMPEQRFAIARDVKEAIKARFAPETWRGVTQPIFDRLRQRQRDALAAHVLHTRGFERLEQLYEFFLVDPGMEPVVQTSRIRLAIASVQLFIQRCLLNLEASVHPSAILNAEHWEWVKRYRVWEANRKIFLFPENWLEPEFRDDKTHLFTELEGALFQGDVSQDLVEDAFLNYLRKMDELARLDLVAMHLEQGDEPGQNALHVFGRTFSQPHKYFYRCYAGGRWTPWQPVTAEIEGDHLAPVVWRGRLYLFWVTFMEKPIPNKTKLKMPKAGEDLPSPAEPVIDLEARLNWSEYLNGEWSTRESSGFDASAVITVTNGKLSDINKLFVHVSKEVVDGEERGVFVHLVAEGISGIIARKYCPPNQPCEPDLDDDEPDLDDLVLSPEGGGSAPGVQTRAFYLAGRNSSLVKAGGLPAPANRYSAQTPRANRYSGTIPLTVTFQQRITTEPGKNPEPSASPSTILGSLDSGYTLLPCDNRLALKVPESAYEGAADPDQVKAALQGSLEELESLIRPVVYQDNTHTFFIEPDVAERTVEQWETWIRPTPPTHTFDPSALHEWQIQHVRPHHPDSGRALPRLSSVGDWLVNRATLVRFDGQLIGPQGQIPLTFEQATPAMSRLGVPVRVNSAGAIDTAQVAVLGEGLTLEQVGLTQPASGLHVVGGAGVNKAMMNEFDR